MLKYFSVCSGIEAATVAWSQLGWQAVAFSEIEKFPCAVLAHHYPHVSNLGDMTKIDGAQFKGKVDIVIGGTPCQAFSVAGKRKSLEDDRGNLTLVFLELCDAIEPHVIVWENVPGVLNTDDNAFGIFLGRLSGTEIELIPPRKRWGNAGYVLGRKRNIAWRVLNAQYFGVPQRRKRVFVIASPRDGADPRAILFERTSVPRDLEKSRKKGKNTSCKTPSDARTNLFSEVDPLDYREKEVVSPLRHKGSRCENLIVTGFRESGFSDFVNTNVAGTLKKSGGSIGGGTETLLCLQGNMVRPNSGCNGKGWNDENVSYTLTAGDRHVVMYENNPSDARVKEVDICPTIKARYGTGGGQTPYVMYENYVRDARVNEVEICPTLRSNMGNSIPIVKQDYSIRRLMPIECERLQGFPDNYTQIPYNRKKIENCPDSPRYESLGNSMAIPVIKWLGERIQKIMEEHHVTISPH